MWKTKRVTTSRITERRRDGRCGPAASQAPEPSAESGPESDRPRQFTWSSSRARATASPRRKTRLATPVAAASTTDSSPIVSQARTSTRMTLTML